MLCLCFLPCAQRYIRYGHNKKHRQPDVVCLIDGAKVGSFFEIFRLAYVNPMKKVQLLISYIKDISSNKQS